MLCNRSKWTHVPGDKLHGPHRVEIKASQSHCRSPPAALCPPTNLYPHRTAPIPTQYPSSQAPAAVHHPVYIHDPRSKDAALAARLFASASAPASQPAPAALCAPGLATTSPPRHPATARPGTSSSSSPGAGSGTSSSRSSSGRRSRSTTTALQPDCRQQRRLSSQHADVARTPAAIE